jgi:hypothetical protein
MVMIKPTLVFFIILLFLMHSGCLVRYGEDRLNHLLSSLDDLKSECEKSDKKLTEEQIKEKLGKPGWLKPIYENNLDISLLDKLKRDSGVSLEPYPQNLYNVMLEDINNGRLKSIKLLSYVYDRMGQDDPSLTFYIGNYADTSEHTRSIIGWDYVKYDYSYQRSVSKRREIFVNYKIDPPVDYLRLPYTFLIDAIIGLKQFVGEVVKSPVSFIEAELFENIFIENKFPLYKFNGFKSVYEDWRNGIKALTFRHRVDGKQGILAITQNLLGEVPIVGSVLDQWYKKENDAAEKLFLTRGINGGNDSAQNTALWTHFFADLSEKQYSSTQDVLARGDDEKETNGFYVKAIPYRYGSIIDVIWSLLNISHGYAYDMASEIVFGNEVDPGDSVLLSGHSGGVQRIVSTARILYDDGIKVEKMYGIAGPAVGYAPCSKVEVELNGKILQDPTSDVSRLLNYLTLNSLTNIKWRYNNEVDKSYKHRTPGFVDGRTRLSYDGFLKKSLKDFFW